MSEVENQGPTDDELLNDVLSDEPADPPEQQAQIEQVEEPETVVAEGVAGTELTAEKPPIPPKPEWRLREDAERARNAETELANERAEKAALRQRLEALERQSKPPKEETDDGPDPLLDPKGYAKHVREEIRQELLTERREDSMRTARETNTEAFDQAYQASLQAMQSGDVTIRVRMQNSRDPGKELLKWHGEQKARQEVGTDLAAYKQRLRDEALKDPEFRKAAQEAWKSETQLPNGRPRVDLPPSLNGASRANTALKSTVDDVSDDQLFHEVAG